MVFLPSRAGNLHEAARFGRLEDRNTGSAEQATEKKA